MNIVFETARLSLRRLVWDDLEFLAAMLADPLVMRHYPHCFSRDEAEAWLRRQLDGYATYGYAYWLVRERSSGRPVGQAGLLTAEVDGVPEPALGYMFHYPYWGRGYATEASFGALDYGFRVLRKDRLICLVRPENVASLRVVWKLGMRPERFVRYKGIDHLYFALGCSGFVPRPAV